MWQYQNSMAAIDNMENMSTKFDNLGKTRDWSREKLVTEFVKNSGKKALNFLDE